MNVILLVNDTFRRDHLGCYGSERIATPNLDAFAARSAIFDQYYIGSYPTVPNRWDMAVGRFGFPTRGWEPLRPEDQTLAQFLSRQGVHTQMIWDTPMLAMHDYNYTRGFKGILFSHGQKGDPWITNPDLPVRFQGQPHKIKNVKSLDGYLRNHFDRRHERQYPVARTMSDAIEWLETNYNHERFFLYVDMWDPHEPFDSPWYDYGRYADPAYDGDQLTYPQYGRPTFMTPAEHQNVRDLYAGCVTLVDRWIGRFLEMAENLGLFENTLIIWTTDHGHLFGEHDLHGKPGAQMGRLYEETARIPLLVHHPQDWGAGQRIQGIVQPVDLMPSILEAMAIPAPEHIEGRSFWPLVNGTAPQGRRYAFSNRYPQNAATVGEAGAAFDGWVGSGRVVEPGTVTDDTWAYICMPAGLPSELYHLKDDPQQTRNVIDAHPDVAAEMKAAWLAFLQDHGASEARIQPFVEASTAMPDISEQILYAFRDDMGQWIAFSTEEEALAMAYRADAPGQPREVEPVTFSRLLEDHPRNLVHFYDQYYWAEDLVQ
jgi:arylsulfatase A-like enzyme